MARAPRKPADEGEHFDEGLVHLADMLELADPRRTGAGESQAKLRAAGLSMPVSGTYEDWKKFCLQVASQLRAAAPKIATPDGQASMDAAIARIEQMVE